MCFHNVVQPSLSPNFGIFTSPPKRNPVPRSSHSPFHTLPSPWSCPSTSSVFSHFLFYSVHLPVLDVWIPGTLTWGPLGWLLALAMFSRSIHMVPCPSAAVPSMADQHALCDWTIGPPACPSTMDGHLGLSPHLPPVSNAAWTRAFSSSGLKWSPHLTHQGHACPGAQDLLCPWDRHWPSDL